MTKRKPREEPAVVPAELPRDVEANDQEWQRAGGAPQPQQPTPARRRTARKGDTQPSPEFKDAAPAAFERDVEENDEEWQRAGGGSGDKPPAK
jgi:hypothetical protein